MENISELEAQKSDLEARLKEIEQQKADLLLENKICRRSIDSLFSQAVFKKKKLNQDAADTCEMIGIQKSDMHRYVGKGGRSRMQQAIKKAVPDKEPARLLACDLSFLYLATTEQDAIIKQYKYFNKTGDFSNFCNNARADIMEHLNEILHGADMATTAYADIFRGLNDFEEKMKSYKENENRTKSLDAQLSATLKKKSKLEWQIANSKQEALACNTLIPIYSNWGRYQTAQAQAQALKTVLEESRQDKLVKIRTELDGLSTEFAKSQRNLLPFASQAYSILQQYSKTNNGDCTALLSAKKELLAACKNCDPEKELGLFRAKVLMPYDCGYIEKKHTPIALATFRQMDDAMIMRLQNLRELDAKINKLSANYVALQGKYS